MVRLALALIICLSFTILAHADEQTVTIAGMSVTVWSEGTNATARQPIIIFSHGFHGCATQSRFLTEAFASAGYLVFAPNHRDATCHGGKASFLDRPKPPLRKPELWNHTTFEDRRDDLLRLIEALRADYRFRNRIDWSRLGLVGHSLGGYTVLGIAGAWRTWKQTGIRGVLALSPYIQPFVENGALSNLSVPVMYQGGTWDFPITPHVTKDGGSYNQTPNPKYYVEFQRAGHFAWTDLRKAFHKSIIAYSLAFMNHYVRGEPADPLLTRMSPDVSALRYDSELGTNEGK